MRFLNLSTVKNFNHTLIQPFCVGLKTSSPCWFLNMFSVIDVLITGFWLKGNERTPHHFIKHDVLRLERRINVTSKHNLITKCLKYAQNYIFGIVYYFNEICMLHFVIFAVRSCGSWPLAFCCGFLWILYLEHSFCCEILQILDP